MVPTPPARGESLPPLASSHMSIREQEPRRIWWARPGKLCGLDQSVISRLENGKLANLRWWRFAALVGALGDAWDPASQRPPGGWW